MRSKSFTYLFLFLIVLLQLRGLRRANFGNTINVLARTRHSKTTTHPLKLLPQNTTALHRRRKRETLAMLNQAGVVINLLLVCTLSRPYHHHSDRRGEYSNSKI